MSANIDKSMRLSDLLREYPDSAKVFAMYGIGCIGCALAAYETIEQGITAHNINLDEFMKDLNSYVSKEED